MNGDIIGVVVDDGLAFVALSLAMVHIVYFSFGRLCWFCPLTCFNAVVACVFVAVVYHCIVVLAVLGVVVVAVHVLLISVLMVVLLIFIVFGHV